MSAQSLYDPALGWAIAEPNEIAVNNEFRDGVMLVQHELSKMEQIDCPVKHHFYDGSYGREIFLPEDTYVIGKIHRHSHVNVISQGECYVLTEEGIRHLVAPATFVSKAGTKRVVYTVKDTIWTTIHVTQSTSLDDIENEIISPTFNDLDTSILEEKVKWLG